MRCLCRERQRIDRIGYETWTDILCKNDCFVTVCSYHDLSVWMGAAVFF